MYKHTNHLAGETSPYLLQHAHNPVDWYPWGKEALIRARRENKPILISIGYAACHWCHVMERESFEDEATAQLMNEHFINIKIDREERPDLDHIYMDALQAMTGSGGWPLNMFLTPATKPFYGGTYFPPVNAFNRQSWKETLQGVAQAFTDRRQEIEAQADNLTDHLLKSNSFGLQQPGKEEGLFTAGQLAEAFQNSMKMADATWGGFGKAPKFPQTFTIQFLLRYYHFSREETALDQALLSLDRMIGGGIYDQLGGGFARYSTDTEWLAPHFEKMLYDNALLVSVLSEAYQLTKKRRYEEVIAETIAFIQREMLHPAHGFYTALDADSEGEEGKFYVWSRQEIQDVLGSTAGLFCDYYDVTIKGNWEGKNILRVKQSEEDFAATRDMEVEALRKILQNNREQLLQHRNTRVRPSLDDKIILGWNALMNTAYCKAFGATGIESYRQQAIANMEFLLKHLATGEGRELHHTWKDDQAKFPAFLDDYAFLIQALIHLQEITGNTGWLEKAKDLAEFVIDEFSEAGTGLFFYTKTGQEDVIVRKKEVYDGAVPSGNSVMAGNLHYLSIVFDRRDWEERSLQMLSSLGKAVISYPTSFGNWNGHLLQRIAGTTEIAIMGKETGSMRSKVLQYFLPHRVIMSATAENQFFPLLAGKKVTDQASVYVCRNFACLQPVTSFEEVISLIDSTNRNN